MNIAAPILSESDPDKLFRYYSVVNKVRSILRKNHEPRKFCQEMCRVAVSEANVDLAWVGKRNTITGMLEVFAFDGAGNELLSNIEHSLKNPSFLDESPCGKAMANNRTVTVNNISCDLGMTEWQKNFGQHGCNSVVAFPLVIKGISWGVIVLYSKEQDYFGPDEVSLMETLAEDINVSIGMDADQSMVQFANARLKMSLDSLHEGCMILDYDWNFIYTNAESAKILRKSVAELEGHRLFDVFPTFVKSPLFQKYQMVMATRKGSDFEACHVLPDGTELWVKVLIRPVDEGVFTLLIDTTDTKVAEKGRLLLEA